MANPFARSPLPYDPNKEIERGLLKGWRPKDVYSPTGPRPSEPHDPSTYRYGRGHGWDRDGRAEKQWERFQRVQVQATDDVDIAADNLRALAGAMQSGKVTKEDFEKLRRFEAVFGKGMATLPNITKVAERYEASSSVLRDQDRYKADLLSRSEWRNRKLTGDALMAVPTDRTKVLVNRSHPDLDTESVVRWSLIHEPMHSDKVGLTDWVGPNLRAYRNSPSPEHRRAYADLLKTPGAAMDNADRLTAYASGKWR